MKRIIKHTRFVSKNIIYVALCLFATYFVVSCFFVQKQERPAYFAFYLEDDMFSNGAAQRQGIQLREAPLSMPSYNGAPQFSRSDAAFSGSLLGRAGGVSALRHTAYSASFSGASSAVRMGRTGAPAAVSYSAPDYNHGASLRLSAAASNAAAAVSVKEPAAASAQRISAIAHHSSAQSATAVAVYRNQFDMNAVGSSVITKPFADALAPAVGGAAPDTDFPDLPDNPTPLGSALLPLALCALLYIGRRRMA